MIPGHPLAEVTREADGGRQRVESVHTGHLAVGDADGNLLAHVGDPDVHVFARSAVKPFQAAACLRVLDGRADALTDEEVAVAWSSHRAEPEQLAAVRSLLRRAGTDEQRLTCPPSRSAADATLPPARLLHNCSGKHAMFALAGSRLDLTGPALLDPDRPLQHEVLAEVARWLGEPVAVGIDGCGAPAVVVELRALVRAAASLAGDEALARVRDAGLRHPSLVGGAGRLESALLTAEVVAKVGAEGIYVAGWIGEDGAARGLVARAADGAARGSAAAVIGLLEASGVVPPGTWTPPLPQGGGRPVGVVRASAAVLALADRLSGR